MKLGIDAVEYERLTRIAGDLYAKWKGCPYKSEAARRAFARYDIAETRRAEAKAMMLESIDRRSLI